MTSEYMKLQEAAERLGVHRTTIFRWYKSGLLEGYHLNRMVTLITRSSVERRLKQRGGGKV